MNRIPMFKKSTICLLTTILLSPAFAVRGEPPKNQPAPAAKTAKAPERAAMTPEREAAAITFVRQHHAELVDLLNQLKETKPAEYQAAIRELFQTSERLAQLREQDPQRYELELAAWKIKSRIQLLAARSTMSGDKSFEEQLRAALAEQADVRLNLLKLERDRTADRLQKLDKGIEQFQTGEAAEIERQFARLMKNISGSRQQIKAGNPPAAAAKTNPKPEPSAASVAPK
jgi:hypothetical protein